MADNKNYISYVSENGSIHISEEVVSAIAADAVLEVEGVTGLRSSSGKESERSKRNAGKAVKVFLDNNTLSIDISLYSGASVPLADLGSSVQQAVKAAVEAATGVQVQSVNVTVCGIKMN